MLIPYQYLINKLNNTKRKAIWITPFIFVVAFLDTWKSEEKLSGWQCGVMLMHVALRDTHDPTALDVYSPFKFTRTYMDRFQLCINLWLLFSLWDISCGKWKRSVEEIKWAHSHGYTFHMSKCVTHHVRECHSHMFFFFEFHMF